MAYTYFTTNLQHYPQMLTAKAASELKSFKQATVRCLGSVAETSPPVSSTICVRVLFQITDALRQLAEVGVEVAKNSNNPPPPNNVFEDAEENNQESEYNRVYNFGESIKVDLAGKFIVATTPRWSEFVTTCTTICNQTAEDGRGWDYPEEHNERRPEIMTGDEVERGRDRWLTREARVLAGYKRNVKAGADTALEEGR